MKLRYVLAALLVSVAGCASSGSSSPKPSALNDQVGGGIFQGVGLVPARPRPAFTLDDTSGVPYSFATKTHGRTTLLFFGYTNCPDICPATMADIAGALRSLPASVQRKITVTFVSTDVRNDTGPVISAWLNNFTPGTRATFVGLRGTQAQVDAAQAAAHVMLAEDGGQTHSTEVLVFGPDDYAHVSFIYNDKTEQDQMAHDLPLVVRGRT
jgi:protein SCO1/2